MRKQKSVVITIMISVLLIILSRQVPAEGRSIFVGDLINIRVSTQKFTREEIKDQFKEFEIVDLKSDADGWIITLRSFETGTKTVQLGDKELAITIKSTLDEIEREGIFEGNSSPEEAAFSIDWQYAFYILLIIFLISGGVNLQRVIKKRKISSITPYRYFIDNTEKVSLYSDKYFVKLTKYFKIYMELKFSVRIRGKTSNEIIKEINCLNDLQPKLPEIEAWLTESDYCKFAGVTVSEKKKQELYEKLIKLVSKIEEKKEVEAWSG